MPKADDYDRHRRLLGALPIALSPMFDPFVELLIELDAPALGSFSIRKLDAKADARLRLLCIPFDDHASAVAFLLRLLGEATQRDVIDELLAKVGPGAIIEVDKTSLLFWFGLIGVEITRH